MVAHKKSNKHKQHGRIIAAQTSASTTSTQRLNFCSNLSVLLRNTTLGRDIPKKNWQTFTVSILFVPNNFMKSLLNAKSIELKPDVLSEQAWRRFYNASARHRLPSLFFLSFPLFFCVFPVFLPSYHPSDPFLSSPLIFWVTSFKSTQGPGERCKLPVDYGQRKRQLPSVLGDRMRHTVFRAILSGNFKKFPLVNWLSSINRKANAKFNFNANHITKIVLFSWNLQRRTVWQSKRALNIMPVITHLWFACDSCRYVNVNKCVLRLIDRLVEFFTNLPLSFIIGLFHCILTQKLHLA